jgi:hypothetical protein
MNDRFIQYQPQEHSSRSHSSNRQLTTNASSRDLTPSHSTVSTINSVQKYTDAVSTPPGSSQRSELQTPFQSDHLPSIIPPSSQPRDSNYPQVASTEPSFPSPGFGGTLDDHTNTKPGRRRKPKSVSRGTKVSIPNIVRDKALAETRLKRARHEKNDNESADELDDTVHDDNQSKKLKRGEHSCDQCYNRKARVCLPFCSEKLLTV